MALIELASDLAVARQLFAEEISALVRESDAIERGLEAVRDDCKSQSVRLTEAQTRLEAALGVVARQLAGLRRAIHVLRGRGLVLPRDRGGFVIYNFDVHFPGGLNDGA